MTKIDNDEFIYSRFCRLANFEGGKILYIYLYNSVQGLGDLVPEDVDEAAALTVNQQLHYRAQHLQYNKILTG